MGRVHEFVNSGRTCFRREMDGHPLEIVTQTVTTPYRGKAYPTTVERWTGLHEVYDGQEIRLADRSMVSDAGPKLGVTLVYTVHPDMPLPETRQRQRANLNAVLRQMGYALMEED